MNVREKAKNDKRLIDANAFLKDILTAEIGKTIIEYSESDIGYMIRKRPTVDAVEVVHGRWMCHGDCGVTECSVCGWSIEEYVGDYAYCPNCGAKMDLEG